MQPGGTAPKGIVSGTRVRDHAIFEDRILRAATGLERLGVGQDDSVAILMRNDMAFLEATLATQRLGAYAVPVNWHFKSEEIAWVLADCGAKVLVVHADLLHALDPGTVPAGTRIIGVAVPPEIAAAYPAHATPGAPEAHADWETWLAALPPHAGPALPASQSMIYTSGTTGHPKGVRRDRPTTEQQQGLDEARRVTNGLEPGVRALMPGPLYHAAPNAFALRASRIADALVLMPRFDAETFLEVVERHRITTTFMVPTMFVRLLKLPEATRRRYDVSSLSFVMHAAAPCPPDVKRAMIDWLGPIVWEFYGSTEVGAVSIISAEEWLRKPGSVGRPAKGARIAILDEAGREQPAGVAGEVFSRLSFYPEFTYHKQPEKRAEIERNGLITCGDVGYLDADGYLFLCDRKRDMVIAGGVNIYPAEIEAVLVGLDGVKDCAVFGIPHDDLGEELLAIVEPMPGREMTPEAVRAHLALHLANYKVPRRVEIRSGLPREDSGKLFKRRLREPYWADTGRRI